MAVNDTIQLVVRGTVAGQTHLHTLHFRCLDVTPVEQALINDYQANARVAYATCFSTADLPVQLFIARQVCGSVPLRAPVEEAEIPANQAGAQAVAGERLPSWLAACTSLRTAFAGKSRRGRFYLGGLFEAWTVGNDLTAARMAMDQFYLDALMGRYGPSGTSNQFRLVIYSQKLASVPGTACQDSSTVVTSGIVNSAVATMKSRKPGSGT